jgi:hypothetical protein
MTIDPNGQH